MKLIKFVRSGALAAMLFTAGVANAALLQFTLTGDYAATWQLDSQLTPNNAINDFYFKVSNVGTFPDATGGVAEVTFFNAALGGGFSIYDDRGTGNLVITNGPQLYTGSEFNPSFTLGSFALVAFSGNGTYVLKIAEADAAAVPEPATGALLLGGLGLMYVLRKRRQA
jgi:hypothetical protein